MKQGVLFALMAAITCVRTYPGRLTLLGHRQQPHNEGVGERRYSDRRYERPGCRRGQTCACRLVGLSMPPLTTTLLTGLVGFGGYGLSLVLFVLALRNPGTARTGACFSAAPFVGAAASLVVLKETPGTAFWGAAALMGAGIWMHLTEHREHDHLHEALAHGHKHSHDEQRRQLQPDGVCRCAASRPSGPSSPAATRSRPAALASYSSASADFTQFSGAAVSAPAWPV